MVRGTLTNGFLTGTYPFRLIVLSCLFIMERRAETPVDFFGSEARVELDFLLSLKHERFKHCLSDGNVFGGLPALAQLLVAPLSFLTTVLETPVFSLNFFCLFLSLCNMDYLIS